MSKHEQDVLDPRPIGWFAVGLAEELRPGAETAGVLCAAPYKIGRKLDGSLYFSGSIQEISEQNGFLLAWHHPKKKAPTFEVPELSNEGYRPLRYHTLHARSHPQETYENSVDLAHFPTIHGYSDIRVLRPMTCEGHTMNVSYEIARDNPFPLPGKTVSNFEVFLHGIGCAHNHINVPAVGLRVRMFALSTPTRPGHVDLRLGVAIGKEIKLPFAPLLLPFVHRAAMFGIVNDFSQDMIVWEQKRYLSRPVLSKNDGPIMAFRKWSRQFSAAA